MKPLTLIAYLFTRTAPLFFMFTCTQELDKNKRVLVTGTIEDANGAPVSDVDIFTHVNDIRFLDFGNDGYESRLLLGVNKSKSDGSFAITSLYDSGLTFTTQFGTTADPYVNYSYTILPSQLNQENLNIDLGTIILNKTAEVTFTIQKTNSNNSTLSFYFSFDSVECIEVYEDGEYNEEFSNCSEIQILSGRTTEDNVNASGSFTTILGSMVEFSYTIDNDQPVVERFEVTQEQQNYELNY